VANSNRFSLDDETLDRQPRLDEGGLRAPPDLRGWDRAWWWFHFLILVNLARLRFIAILVVIGVIIMKWDWLVANYDKWTRPANGGGAARTLYTRRPGDSCRIPTFMPLSRKKGRRPTLPAGVAVRWLSLFASCWPR
jgi:hypothetical protein